MVDTFTCDSCGRDNIPKPDKKKLLVSETMELPNTDGTTNTATVTQGMEICPDCRGEGIVKNSIVVDAKSGRKFAWRPNKSLAKTFFWQTAEQKAKKGKKQED